ncbi:MAG: hypothetical protein ACE5KD_03615 [Candidatus Bathyarchaeia archaeon]
MAERKQRKDLQDFLDFDEPDNFILTEPEPIEIASGYSISVKYDKNGRPLIYVKKYGDVDTKGLRREIERNYPGAAIQGLEKPQPIEVKNNQKPRKPHVKHRKRGKKATRRTLTPNV